ncbi:hypothetical protein BCON_0111g00080 [Botryotinia convoluta]|uniref:Uncharacterized protein n=1 Tax=Botryotinia convoluta TaxID=54673 RepID=A0A4Z1HYN3_9HELO|nr:hypothetical protein BCON_0111g00080 [Botryotinia convoluta]
MLSEWTGLRQDIYKRRYENGTWIYSLVDYSRKLTVNERLKITHTIPAILSESRYHTAEELEKAGYHFMNGGKKHQFEAYHTDKPPTRFTSHLRLSEVELAQCGLLEGLGKLREIALHPDFQTGLAATMKRKYSYYPQRKGMQYQIGVTKQPGHGLNYTKQRTAIEDASKGKAHLHCDKDNQPTSYSVVFFMSNFDDWHCPGHFINTTWRTIFPASPFQVVGRSRSSITITSSIGSTLVPKFKELNIEIWQPQGLHVLKNIRAHQEWKLRLFIKQEALFKLLALLETKVLLQKHFPEWIRNWWWMMTFAPDMFWHGADDLSHNAEERSLAYFKQLEDETDKNNTKEPLPTKTGKNKRVLPTEEERAITKRLSAYYEDPADWNL